MEILGHTLQTIYLYSLIIGGGLTLLYILFSDILEGLFEFIPDGILNPTLVLSFITLLSSTGYLFEKLTMLNSFLIFIISLLLALLLVTLLNVFVLIPLASAEESNVYTEDDLKGRLGRVIISIPVDGFGEVVLESNSGTISMSANSFENKPIEYDKTVLVIDVQENVLQVVPYEEFN